MFGRDDFEPKEIRDALDVLLMTFGYTEELQSIAKLYLDEIGADPKVTILAKGDIERPDDVLMTYATFE